MNNEKGFITLTLLMVVAVISIVAVYLLGSLELNSIVNNAAEDSLQAYYSAESKLYLLINMDEYYYNQLLPRIKRYIKYGRITPDYDNKIILDEKDLIEDDKYNIVNLNFLIDENNRRVLEVKIDSSRRIISKQLIAELYLINEIFELGMPVVSHDTLTQDQRFEFDNYMEYLEREIYTAELDEGITGVYGSDYDEIDIVGEGNSLRVDYYRSGLSNPIKEEIIINNKIFLLGKNNKNCDIKVNFVSGFDRISLEGILYVEGGLYIYDDFNFKGIIIVNGELNIYPGANVNINGILLTRESIEQLGYDVDPVINYDFLEVKKYGACLPKFIDIRVKKIISN